MPCELKIIQSFFGRWEIKKGVEEIRIDEIAYKVCYLLGKCMLIKLNKHFLYQNV